MNSKVNLDFLKNVPIKIPKFKSRKVFNGKSRQKSLDVPQMEPSGVIHRSPSRISTISSLVDGAPHYDYNLELQSVSAAQDTRLNYEEPAICTKLNRSRSHADVDQVGNSRKMTFPERFSKQCKELSEFKLTNLLGKKTVVKTTEIDVNVYASTLDVDDDDKFSVRSDDNVEFHSLPAGIIEEPNVPRSKTSGDIYQAGRVGSLEKEKPPKLRDIRHSSSEISDHLTLQHIKPNESTLFGRIHKKSTPIEDKAQSKRTSSIDRNGSDGKFTSHRQALNNIYDKARKKVNSKLQKLKQKRQNSISCDPKEPQITKISTIEDTSKPEVNIRERGIHMKSSIYKMSKESNDSDTSGRRKWNSNAHYGLRMDSIESNDSEQQNKWNSGNRLRYSVESDDSTTPRCLQNSTQDDESDEWLRGKRSSGQMQNLHSFSSSDSERHPMPITFNRPAPAIPSRQIGGEKSASKTVVADVHKVHSQVSNNQHFNRMFTRIATRNQSIESVDSDAWIPEQYRRDNDGLAKQKEIDDKCPTWRAFNGNVTTNCQTQLQKRKSIDIFVNGEQKAFEDFDNYLENVPVIHVTEASPTNEQETTRRQSITKQVSVVEGDSPPHVACSSRVNALITRFENPIQGNGDKHIEFEENDSLTVGTGSLPWKDHELDGRTVDEYGSIILARPVSPPPSRQSQILRTSASLEDEAIIRNGARSPITLSRGSSSDSASSTDVQTCIENTINLGIPTDLPIVASPYSGVRRKSMPACVKGQTEYQTKSDGTSNMRRYSTSDSLNRNEFSDSKTSLVDSNDTFASFETARSSDTVDSSESKVQTKIVPPVLPKPRAKVPPPQAPQSIEHSSPKRVAPLPPTRLNSVKKEDNVVLSVNGLKSPVVNPVVPRKSPRRSKTLSIGNEPAPCYGEIITQANEAKQSPAKTTRRSLDLIRKSTQDGEIFYSLETDEPAQPEVGQISPSLGRRAYHRIYGVEI